MLQNIIRATHTTEVRKEDTTFDTGQPNDTGLLPNFCGGEMVVNVIVLAEFLAIVATIITPPITPDIFKDLFLISLFLQWIALSSVGALCFARPHLNRVPERRAVLMAYLLLLCVTWTVSEFALWVMASTGLIESARPSWYVYFHGQNLTVSAIINALALRYFVARHQLRQKTLAEERVRATVLRYRIRPHFLFNSMNIIASLMRRAPARAESAIEDMADLFRLMLDESKDLMPVHQDVKVARKYLKLEKLRLEKRLNTNWQIESVPRTAKTPALMLQLLLENAIHHGIEPFPHGGDIDIHLWMEGEQLNTSVRSPALGSSEIRRHDDETAIDNVRLRLHDLYGDAARLEIEKENNSMAVHISHPAFGGT